MVANLSHLAPAFAGERPESLWVSLDDAHPNAKAHGIIAQGIYDGLIRNTLRHLAEG